MKMWLDIEEEYINDMDTLIEVLEEEDIEKIDNITIKIIKEIDGVKGQDTKSMKKEINAIRSSYMLKRV